MTKNTPTWRISFPEGSQKVAVPADVESTAQTTDAAISDAQADTKAEVAEETDAKIGTATKNVVYLGDPEAARQREEDDIAYAVTFNDGKRTWLETDPDGKPTPWSISVMVEALKPYLDGGDGPTGPMNVLLITADDMDVASPGAFGGPDDLTPTLDALAAEGMCFDRAHVSVAVCQPSRSSIITGRWPHRNGAMGFGPIDDEVPVLNDILRPAGYMTGILGKVTHLEPEERFQWDHAVDQPDLGMGRSPQRYYEETAAFLSQAVGAGRPWFLMANTHDPHRPFAGSQQEQDMWTDAQRATYPDPSNDPPIPTDTVPGFLPDLPDVQTEYDQYLHSVRRADDVIASVLSAVDQAGERDNTLIIYLSDNGMAFPFAKSNCYLRSSLTPLIVCWPGITDTPGRQSDHFVSGVDLMPTMIDAAGLTIPDGVDGTSLRTLIETGTDTGRDEIHTVYHEAASGTKYQMRCVQTSQYGYIWNRWSELGTPYEAENMKGLTWPAMQAAAAAGDQAQAERNDFYVNRVPEELYDLQADPDCLTNLIDNPDYAATVDDMRGRVSAWMDATGDPLADVYHNEIA